MAVTANALTSKTQGTGSNIVSASITPGANRLVLIAILVPTGVTVTGVTGCGLTWVQITSRDDGTTAKQYLFRAMGAAPSAGTVTVSFSAVNFSAISIVEFDGVDTSGSDGSGAVAQSATGSGNSANPLATLAAFASANNATWGSFTSGTNNNAITQGAGFTRLHHVTNSARPTLESQWKDTNDTSVDATCTSSRWTAIAVEIVAAAVSQTTALPAIASTEAHGVQTLVVGSRTTVQTGVASLEAVNALVLATKIKSIQAAIASAEAHGVEAVVNRNTIVLPSLTHIGELVGNILIITRASFSLLSIFSAETVPALTIRFAKTVQMGPILSGEGVGVPAVIIGLPHIVWTSIDSSEALGALTYYVEQTTALPAIDSAEATGQLVAIALSHTTWPAIDSAEQLGVQTLLSRYTVVLAGAPSAEAFGIPRFNVFQTTALPGIASAQALGVLTAKSLYAFEIDSIDPEEVVPPLVLMQGPPFLHMVGIPSAEAFGGLSLQTEKTNWFSYIQGTDLGLIRVVPQCDLVVPNIYETGGVILLPAYDENGGLIVP